ncbi:hypothetical protein KMP13_09735 [Epibacterium ulvae]|uniref:hypothetical protein n=1 Tax=Epibacterium ulvae TaxID=1156985 RepID=UPI001BFCA8EC|nr:hypothetical protein [Epibacterium ulvae]MBT8154170.1 hypothetical protein [Epibacterium ulvae]
MRAFFRPLVTGLSIVGLTVTPAMVSAQSTGVLYTVVVPAGGFGSSLFLRDLLGSLATARLFCGQIQDQSLQVDCLSDRLEQVAEEIPEGTDYDEVRSILAETSAELGTLARQNRDRSRGRVKATQPGQGPEGTTRPLNAIAPDALAAVNAQAVDILEEATTKLLRSADNKNRNQYARIAEALESNKVLLRS